MRLLSLFLLLLVLTSCGNEKLEPAPKFKFLQFDGNIASNEALQGKVALITFWATWCLPCVEEIPFFNNLFEKYGTQNFTIIGVNMDDDLTRAKEFLNSMEIKYPTAIKTTNVESLFDITCLPTTVVLNRQGMIVKKFAGKPLFDEFEALVKKEVRKK